MKKELISVIVPIYDIEKYLNKCIESIVNQSYENLEIILIDDGSTDESGKICDKWKEKDGRIKVIHKENGGLSDARNVGIENSTGEILYFIDGDDYIDFDIIDNLYFSLLENNTDISMGGLVRELYFEQKTLYSDKNYVVDSKEILRKMFINEICTTVCNILFKKKLFEDIKFPVGKINEDSATLYKLFDKTDKISHINKAGYYYVQRNGSISHRKFTQEYLSNVEYKEEILKFVERKYPDLIEDAEKYFIKPLNGFIITCKKEKMRKEYLLMKSKLKEYFPRILKNSKIELKLKIKTAYINFIV